MNREQEFTSCLLMVGPPPGSPNDVVRFNEHVSYVRKRSRADVLRQTRDLELWRKQVMRWYFNHVLEQQHAVRVGENRDKYKQWMRDYCWWLKGQSDGD